MLSHWFVDTGFLQFPNIFLLPLYSRFKQGCSQGNVLKIQRSSDNTACCGKQGVNENGSGTTLEKAGAKQQALI